MYGPIVSSATTLTPTRLEGSWERKAIPMIYPVPLPDHSPRLYNNRPFHLLLYQEFILEFNFMVRKAGFRSFLSVAVKGIPRQKDGVLKAVWQLNSNLSNLFTQMFMLHCHIIYSFYSCDGFSWLGNYSFKGQKMNSNVCMK